LLEAIARDALGDSRAAATAVERALDLAEQCCTRRRTYWSGTPGTAPRTPH
jgi:hypothetical protein